MTSFEDQNPEIVMLFEDNNLEKVIFFGGPQFGNSGVFLGVYSMRKSTKKVDLTVKGVSDEYLNTFSMFGEVISLIGSL